MTKQLMCNQEKIQKKKQQQTKSILFLSRSQSQFRAVYNVFILFTYRSGTPVYKECTNKIFA